LTLTATLTNYDKNASGYDQFRRPSPILLEILSNTFANAKGEILSVGCGTGRYEEILAQHMCVIGLDRSAGMLNLAKDRCLFLTQGDMTCLPYADESVSGVYFMQSLHHVGANLNITSQERDQARQLALRQAIRVLDQGPLIIVQRDPSQNQAVWFWKYFPRALETKLIIQPKISTLVAWLEGMGLTQVTAQPINDPMNRRFYDPRAPLDAEFRRSHSDFSYLSAADVVQGVEKLRLAIPSGAVDDDIQRCRRKFEEIGGTVFIVSAIKS